MLVARRELLEDKGSWTADDAADDAQDTMGGDRDHRGGEGRGGESVRVRGCYLQRWRNSVNAVSRPNKTIDKWCVPLSRPPPMLARTGTLISCRGASRVHTLNKGGGGEGGEGVGGALLVQCGQILRGDVLLVGGDSLYAALGQGLHESSGGGSICSTSSGQRSVGGRDTIVLVPWR